MRLQLAGRLCRGEGVRCSRDHDASCCWHNASDLSTYLLQLAQLSLQTGSAQNSDLHVMTQAWYFKYKLPYTDRQRPFFDQCMIDMSLVALPAH